MIVLGTHEVAVDLLEKRSAKYSDRVHSTMAYLTGWDWALPIIPYGAWWRRSRRAFHEHFNASVIVRYRAVQLEAMGRFLRRLLESPEAFERHIKHFIASSTIRLAYGVDVDKEEDTPYLEIATAAVATFAATFVPGKYLVETFPALRFLPSWMPGAQFKRDGQAWKPRVRRLQETPWNACMSDMLFTTLMTFFLAMASYPEIQTRAQAELDAVVGTNRLPHFDDAGAAPYVVALMKECTRWRVVIPFGILHRSTEEDVYRGRRIPKGTIVVPNQWCVVPFSRALAEKGWLTNTGCARRAFTREERYYPDPEEFRPERYLKEGTCDPGVLDPGDIIFGADTEALHCCSPTSPVSACPGRDFAQAELFVVMASVLHAFTIRPARDAHGVPIPLESAMSDGALS
ncbi:hypothetical protein BN946_scf184573.g11 [Trametes cinnabarina]|uniref:Cytochrome P450 n=1 Tax=Pycnoporus cinnabarinus TaxID=5643 RepID=A0A060SDR3_PYCCI|nr:hypothetical protein BN946_scf184573.g11 [Trametes cinnabarina]